MELADRHCQLGYRKLHWMLVQNGFRMNLKLTWRLYREEGLALRRVVRKKIPQGGRERSMCPIECDQRWSLDFTEDSLSTGRAFRTANLKDDYSRECVALDVDHSLPGTRVAEMLERAVRERGRAPDIITVDNGTEFRSRALLSWASGRRVQMFFIDPGKPTQNPFIESFNGRFRIECLNVSWFTSIDEARRIIEEWRVHYNEERPHQSLGYMTPAAFAATSPRFEIPDPDMRGPRPGKE